jgi:exodeoxyribonuclease VII small subunit
MKTKSFEEKLATSKALLEKLADPEITLEASVTLYEEGLRNIKEAQILIEEAKIKIDTIDKEHYHV